jgi:biopolymer transport protein ExbD
MKIRRRAKANPEIPTCSMADIAFLLIIFFLVTTTMSMDRGLGLQLPAVGQAQKVPRKDLLSIWINATNEVAIEGEVIPVGEIERIIRQRIDENPHLIVSVKTAPEARYETMIDVLDELKLAGAQRISLAKPDKSP